MKKILAIVLVLTFLLSGCGTPAVPGEYADVINDLKAVVSYRLSPVYEEDAMYRGDYARIQGLSDTLLEQISDFELGHYFGISMIIPMTAGLDNPTVKSFGYALDDINGDGVSELFWVRSDRVMLAAFTIADGKAVPINFYGIERLGMIQDNGELFTCMEGYGGYCTRGVLQNNSTEIETVFSITYDGRSGDTKICHQVVDGERIEIDGETYEKLWAENAYAKTARWNALTFYPVG